jgi:hypothetical protein
MALRTEDLGELIYGGLVTGAAYWDDDRIKKGTLASTKFWKRFSTYTYLVIGLGAFAMSAMRWMPRYAVWEEHITHGFIYGLPGFAVNMIRSFQTPPAGPLGGNAAAQAQRLVDQRRMAANRQLGAGRGAGWIANVPVSGRSTEYSVVSDNDILV